MGNKVTLSLWIDIGPYWPQPYLVAATTPSSSPLITGYKRYRIEVEIDDPRDAHVDEHFDVVGKEE